MADERAKKSEAKPEGAETAAAAAKAGGKKKLIGIVAAVMIVEGLGVFGAMKIMGAGPGKTAAAPLLAVEKYEPERIEEVEIAQVRAPNVKEGKLVLWSLHVAIRANCGAAKEEKREEKSEKEEGEGKPVKKPKAESAVVKKIKMNERTIKDRMARIVRSAEPQYLQEDGLETIRRQIKFELERILGEEVKIVEVLVPECTPYPTGY